MPLAIPNKKRADKNYYIKNERGDTTIDLIDI